MFSLTNGKYVGNLTKQIMMIINQKYFKFTCTYWMIFLRWKLQSQYKVLIWSFLLPLKRSGYIHNSTFLINKELSSDKANRDLPKIWLLAVSCISLSEKSHEFRQNSFESKLREEEKYSHISLAYITYSHNMADCVVYLLST